MKSKSTIQTQIRKLKKTPSNYVLVDMAQTAMIQALLWVISDGQLTPTRNIELQEMMYAERARRAKDRRP